jgi:hypothetical protein
MLCNTPLSSQSGRPVGMFQLPVFHERAIEDSGQSAVSVTGHRAMDALELAVERIAHVLKDVDE